jgi:hypothetical protein
VPVIAAIGSGLGLADVRTGDELDTRVAMHFEYDFLRSTAAFVVDPRRPPFIVQYGARL